MGKRDSIFSRCFRYERSFLNFESIAYRISVPWIILNIYLVHVHFNLRNIQINNSIQIFRRSFDFRVFFFLRGKRERSYVRFYLAMKIRDADAAPSFFQMCDIARFSSELSKTRIRVGGEWTAHNILHEWMRRYRLKKTGLSNLRLNVEEIGGGSLQSPSEITSVRQVR